MTVEMMLMTISIMMGISGFLTSHESFVWPSPTHLVLLFQYSWFEIPIDLLFEFQYELKLRMLLDWYGIHMESLNLIQLLLLLLLMAMVKQFMGLHVVEFD
ncbi:hypothetical protein QVD17_30811 [Tagetes erecta]|uniref:Uncharacterized protein n=1 Tax=Tagetes erecta TaxID=13708 RepID=A0AAD8K2J1_TARER|nr:hypothetical protein QVD17_30811 [Tagetes erecta]